MHAQLFEMLSCLEKLTDQTSLYLGQPTLTLRYPMLASTVGSWMKKVLSTKHGQSFTNDLTGVFVKANKA
jgi:hypothetical protein